MASRQHVHRAVAAGISGGACLVLPLAAYAAAFPFEGVPQVIAAGAVPFAVGSIAGVGLCSLSQVLVDRAEERADTVGEASGTAGAYSPEDAGARKAEPSAASSAASEASGRLFSIPWGKSADDQRPMPKGVPVIARAQDALPEDEAWAQIDSLFDDSPVSCDAATSKDIYQIAFEELARGAAGRGAEDTRAEAHADGAEGRPDPAAKADAGAQADAPDAAVTSAIPALEAPAATTAHLDADHERAYDTDAARLAALASLDAAPVDADATGKIAELDDAGETARILAAADDAATTASLVKDDAVEAPISAAPKGTSRPAPTIPMADYSGHEDMWASALEILGDGAADASAVATDVSVQSEEAHAVSAPARVGNHFAVEPMPVPAPRARRHAAAPVTIERAEAVAEGDRATAMHSRVNEILGEEVAKVRSTSMHRTAREYLRVIEGGTMSMPRLRAEA